MSAQPRRLKPRTARSVAMVMILVAAGLLAAGAAATATRTLAPMAAGDPTATERSLSRSTVSLVVLVGAFDGEGGRQLVAGATVAVHHASADTPFLVAETNERGQARFELRPDTYRILVEHEGMTSEFRQAMRTDARVTVIFDENGQPHTSSQSRQDAQRHGTTHALQVVVRQADADRRHAPVEDAHIMVWKVERDEDGAPQREPVARDATGPRGVAVFNLHPGFYVVRVETRDGLEAHARLNLNADQTLGVFFDADGNAHTRTQDAPQGRDGRAVQLGVGAVHDDRSPAAGAFLRIYKVTSRDDPDGTAVARAQADRDGRAVFTLEPGNYRIVAELDGKSGEQRVQLSGDTRTMVVLR